MRILSPPLQNHRWLFLIAFLFTLPGMSQTPDSVLQSAPLDEIVRYTVVHQPGVQQARVGEEVIRRTIRGKIADWYPQLNVAYNYQRFFDLQSSVIGGNLIRFGVDHTSSLQFTGSMTLFNRDVLLAATSASEVQLQAGQQTTRTTIEAVVSVTKAFYDVLATMQQVKVSEESIVRLERSLHDARSRYNAGVTDKTDYKRATIQLGNARADLKANEEQLIFKKEYLKTLMGYPLEAELPLLYDTLAMENDLYIDTLQEINYSQHIEYQLLKTQQELQDDNIKYSYWAYLPSLNLFGTYNLNYQNNDFGELYNQRYPYSYVGATLSIPVFQGGKRGIKIREQKFVKEQLAIRKEGLEQQLSTQHTRALAAYKSNLAAFEAQRENVALATEVYDVIALQYQSGVKTYLELTLAESDLRTTRINYYNALYRVLASKLDVQQALGLVEINR